LFARKRSLAYALPIVTLVLAGCGQQSPSPNSTPDTGTAVKQFIQQENSQIQAVNQAFVQESNLFKEVSTKQISYNSFKSSYAKVQSQVSADINSIRNATTPPGAGACKKDYISLLNEGAKVFSDQQKAILPDRSVDKKLAATVQKELNQFVSDSKALASKYGLN
jgi:hypothetical protein